MQTYQIFLMAFSSLVATLAASSVQISPEVFQFEGKGSYHYRADARGLMQIVHPLKNATKGDFGRIQTALEVPADAEGPFLLSFYVSDNNTPAAFSSQDLKRYSLMTDLRVGHRFQRCYVNGEKVWEQDTSLIDRHTPHVVDVSKWIKPGEKNRVELGLFEAVNSDERLLGDTLENTSHQNGRFDTSFARYETRSYWGDVALWWGGERPDLKKESWAGSLEIKRPEISPKLHRAELQQGIEMKVEMAEKLKPEWPWPLEMGLPFAPGMLHAIDELKLSGQAGFSPMSKWKDGSPRWALVHGTLTSPQPQTLSIGKSGGKPERPASVKPLADGKGALLTSGPLSVALSLKEKGALTIRQGGRNMISGVDFYSTTNGSNYNAAWTSLNITRVSDWQSEVRVLGELKNQEGSRLGSCDMELSVFANVPYIRVRMRLIYETPGIAETEVYGVRFAMGEGMEAKAFSGRAVLTGGESGAVIVYRYANHLGPNETLVDEAGIKFQIFKGSEGAKVLHNQPGEAKTSEFWLALKPEEISDEGAAHFAAMVETPPRLDSSRLIRESGVWGPMPEMNQERHGEVYREIVQKHLVPYFSNPRVGLRSFGNYDGFAQNFYWNALHTMYSLYAMTGERFWYDWAERSSWHLRDSLIRHWHPNGERVGGQYAYYQALKEGGRITQADIASATFTVRLQNPHGLYDHWQMTGNDGSRLLADGMVAFLMNDEEMKMSARIESPRHQGWTLIALMRGYSETYQEAILDYAREIAQSANAYIDPRRGTYVEMHGNATMKGTVPFMAGILMSGLREFYQATDDVAEGKKLVKIGWSVFAEMHNPNNTNIAPWIDYEYSPNPYHREPPRFPPLSWLNPGICAGQAYGAVVSEDPALAEIAFRGWQGFLKGEQSIMTPQACYDLPAALYWVERAEALRKK